MPIATIRKKKQDDNALFRVKNVSKGSRMIQTPNGKHTSISSGETREIKLTAAVARAHASAAARRPGKYMEIVPASDEARAMLSGEAAAHSELSDADTGGAPESGVLAPPTGDGAPSLPQDARAELADRADSMDINELRSEARILLGQTWPRNGNTLTRERIKELLTAPA